MSTTSTHDESLSDSFGSEKFSFGYQVSFLSDFSNPESSKKKSKTDSGLSADLPKTVSQIKSDRDSNGSSMSNDDSYKKLYGENDQDDQPQKTPKALKNRAAEARQNKRLYESQESTTEEEIESKKALRERYLKSRGGNKTTSKGNDKSYRSIFGTESDIASADSELPGSLGASSFLDSPNASRTKTGIVQGEQEADLYSRSQTHVPRQTSASRQDVALDDIPEEKKNGIFVNTPMVWTWVIRLVIVAVVITALMKFQIGYVDNTGYDAKATLPMYIWEVVNMDREQNALQGSTMEERPLISTRIRLEQLYIDANNYNEGQGDIPKGMAELEEIGYDTTKYSTDGWDMPMDFTTYRGDFAVISAGLDRIMNTDDDIIYNQDGLKYNRELYTTITQ